MDFNMNEHFADAIVPIFSALFSAAVAIIVPLRTKQIERKLQSEKVQAELYAAKRVECIEKFVKHVHFALDNGLDSYTADESCDMIYLYIDKSLHHYVTDICAALSLNEHHAAESTLTEFCQQLKLLE